MRDESRMRAGRSRTRPPAATAFVVARGALGAIELVLPELMKLTNLTPPPSWGGPGCDRRSTVAVRVLGGRQLVQALVTYLAPEAKVATAGAAVDAIHALSMVALAMISSRWRRAALTEAVVATALAGVGVSLAPSLPHPPSPTRPAVKAACRLGPPAV